MTEEEKQEYIDIALQFTNDVIHGGNERSLIANWVEDRYSVYK